MSEFPSISDCTVDETDIENLPSDSLLERRNESLKCCIWILAEKHLHSVQWWSSTKDFCPFCKSGAYCRLLWKTRNTSTAPGIESVTLQKEPGFNRERGKCEHFLNEEEELYRSGIADWIVGFCNHVSYHTLFWSSFSQKLPFFHWGIPSSVVRWTSRSRKFCFLPFLQILKRLKKVQITT